MVGRRVILILILKEIEMETLKKLLSLGQLIAICLFITGCPKPYQTALTYDMSIRATRVGQDYTAKFLGIIYWDYTNSGNPNCTRQTNADLDRETDYIKFDITFL